MYEQTKVFIGYIRYKKVNCDARKQPTLNNWNPHQIVDHQKQVGFTFTNVNYEDATSWIT
jgi:hypothetical protein